ncbi:hypothetical protein LOAG_05214 [Loa loa]|uniref:Uncharacterized protein n=1 Tax=Loa loa TaxID=7209 RepID=A0A1S0U0C5_LOALO|nr:hypothetical protein LOAG_05214 [Loa loa]EFO23270.1 hypothetical protein LOAG_05214 [Loa loa]
MGSKCYKLMLDCNRRYSLINGVGSISWPGICGNGNGTTSCKYVRFYPLQQKSTEISITCVNGDKNLCSLSLNNWCLGVLKCKKSHSMMIPYVYTWRQHAKMNK